MIENAFYAKLTPQSEEHVILKCDAYADIRDDHNLSESNKLSFNLSSNLTTAQSALI